MSYQDAEESGVDEQREAFEQLRRLQLVSDAALSHLAFDALVAELLARVSDVLAVDTAAVLMLDTERGVLELCASRGLDAYDADLDMSIPLGAGFAGRIALEARPLMIDDVAAADIVRPALKQRGLTSLLGVPLIVAGHVTGVLHVGSLARTRFGERDVRLLQLVADRVAIALDHARLYEREHRVAETLQRSLLPEQLPHVPGLEVAVRYVPGAQGLAVGGDWYDVIPLPRGHVGVVVGDVAGRGLPAAAVMGRLRNALRAFAFEELRPSEVVMRLDRFLHRLHPEEFATLVYIVIDPATSLLRIACAGHPPPLIVACDGAARFLALDPDPPLGVQRDGIYREQVAVLEPGSMLLLYTDGLVERRSRDLEAGLLCLQEAMAGRRDVGLEELADHALHRLGAGDAGDDVALLALRLLADSGPRLRLTVPAEPAHGPPMRWALTRWLGDACATSDEAYDIATAANEAVANAIQHAYRASGGTIELDAAMLDDGVTIIVRDHGTWTGDADAGAGRGMQLMTTLMDTVEVRRGSAGTEVHMSRRLAPRSRALKKS